MEKGIVVVTGGAGYLGGAACLRLLEKGYRPISLDKAPLVGGKWESHLVDLADARLARQAWDGIPEVTAVLHFAALALVAESVKYPEEYKRNNVQATLNCAEGALRKKARAFVHSSSCAVYGFPEKQPISESTALAPISPYGESKRLSEKVLSDFVPRGLPALNLRYFNPGGAMDSLRWGERHEPETHLIPLIFRAAHTGEPLPILGADYPTPDGTCVRDFLHVEDLIDAHLLALDELESGASLPAAINLGGGRGYSVKEVLSKAASVVGRPIPSVARARRPGDPATLVADISEAERKLRWKPKRTLDDILASQWAWENR